MTNDCTIISNTMITNNMLPPVSTFKMSSSGSTHTYVHTCPVSSGQARLQHQQRLHICSHYENLLSRCTINNLLKFIILYFNNFVLPRPRYLYIILVRHDELPEDDILNVETCSSMLFVIIVFDIIVQSLVKLQIIKNARYWYQNKNNT